MISMRFFLLRCLFGDLVRVLVVLALAGATGSVMASDLGFAKSELERIARSSMTNDQRKALNLADRYQRFKASEKRNSAANPAPPAVPAAGGASSSASLGGSRSSPISESEGGAALATFSLSSADCTEMLLPISEKTLKKSAIEQLQRQLTKLGLYHFSIDGLVGSRTRIALRNFCESARFALADDLQIMLRNHQTIAAKHPSWVEKLASQDFARWARSQADFQDIEQTRHLGDAKAVIALLERFESRGGGKPRRGGDDYQISYNLSKDDLQHLKSAKEITKRVESLQSGKFATAHDFDAALEKAFKGIANAERFISLIRDYADVSTSLSLTEQSFRSLKTKNVAPHIIQAMETLRGLSYPDTDIAGAVEQVIVGLQNGLKGFKPEELVSLAEFSSEGGRFTRESMKKFAAAYDAADPMTPAIGSRMRAMMEFAYQDRASMTAAMRNVLRQLLEEINQVAPIIVAEAEELTEYSIGEEAVQEIIERLRSLLVPEVYVDMLSGIEGIDYPSPDLFWMATKSRFTLNDGDNTLREAIINAAKREHVSRIDDGFLGQLRDEKLPASMIAQLASLKGKEFSTTQALEIAIDDLFVKLEANFEQYRPMVVAQAKKIHRYDKSKIINWTGGKCNCSAPNLRGEVYGIYPFWLAGDSQEIDFNVVSRIGYFAMNFDDYGNISNPSRWQEQDEHFIRVARSYDVGIDLVLTKNDWRGWAQMGSQEKIAAISTLVDNINSAVTQPLADVFSLVKPYISLGLSATPSKADGVTLFIDNYPDTEDAIESFDLLIRQLSDRLQSDGRSFYLNVMFSSSQLGRGIFQVNRLSRTLETIVSHSRLKARFLVLLQEPSEDDRARVRARIEQKLEGRHRLDLLRSVVMVITSDGRNQHRLNDNATFAEDNFGGLGFWVQPSFAAGTGAENIYSKAIKSTYLSTGISTGIQHTAFCSVVCPNRWGFRIAWGVFLLMLLSATVVYFYSCNYRVYLEQYFVWLIVGVAVPVFLLTMVLLSCDPGWAQLSRGNSLLVLVIMGVLAYALWNYRKRKALMDLP